MDKKTRLPYLEYLYLGNNNLNNTILSSLSGLSSVASLSLAANKLEGEIDLSVIYDSMKNLQFLDVGHNQINRLVVNKDARAGFGFRQLQDLSISNVSFDDGDALFQSLGLFPSLKNLGMSFNNFSGIMMSSAAAEELHNSMQVERLVMTDSSLHISLLLNIGAFTSLESLYMLDCQLKGTPAKHELSYMKNLKSLEVQETNLDNSFVQSIGQWTSLQDLILVKFVETNPGQFLQGLCGLENLQSLDLSGNYMKDELPWCFANLKSLGSIDISFNQISGNISSIPVSIEHLDLSENHFQIPSSLRPFYNHSKLKTFYADNNRIDADIDTGTESHSSLYPKFQLTSLSLSCWGDQDRIPFPKYLYFQHDLEDVDLSHNHLTGEFPSWLLDNNTYLKTLYLTNNTLRGSFQLPTHSHHNLMVLDISNNLLEGKIPVEVGAYLPGLYYLNISINHLSGSLPSSIGDMRLLRSLDLSDNSLSGNIPYSLTKCPILLGLYLSNNRLTGMIPHWVGEMRNLVDLVLGNNHLQGPIPLKLCQLDKLQLLDMADNQISGSLPSCFSPPEIVQLHMARNKLNGEITQALYNSSSLMSLDLSYNDISGSIPNWINRLSNLSYLILSYNKLEGEVGSQLCQLPRLRLLDLSHNNLFGKIPTCLDMTAMQGDYTVPSNITNYKDDNFFLAQSINHSHVNGGRKHEDSLQFTTKNNPYSFRGRILNYISGIDLSCNKFSGEIPPRIGNLTRIQTMNLSHNNLTGLIPSMFSNLAQIASLDLSHNYLTGKIPPEIVDLNFLSVFSVAYNNLSGKTPAMKGQFSTFEESSYIGNPLLCGLPLPVNCTSPPAVKAIGDAKEDYASIDMVDFYISSALGYTIVILTFVAVLVVNPYWRRRWFYLIETWMMSSYFFISYHLPRRFRD